jgi:hypothetical protein
VGRFNEIWTPRHQDALRRVFNMRGAAPSPQLAPEIQPVILLHGSPLEDEPELALLHGNTLITARVSAAAVAAQFSFATLNVLPNTAYLLVIQWVMLNVAGQLQMQGGNQGGAPIGSNIQSRDSRIFNPDVTTAGATNALAGAQGSNAAQPANFAHDLPANTMVRIQAVLGPRNGGANITAWGSVVNTQIVMSLIGYMRRFETSDGF